MKDKNEYLRNEHGVHIGHPRLDTTLCGDAIEGDTPELQPCKTVPRQPVTCGICLDMIAASKTAMTTPNNAGDN